MPNTFIACKKCGALFRANLQPEAPRACPGCDEPCDELHDLDRAAWGSDIFPTEEEQG
jgi:rubrerythrin